MTCNILSVILSYSLPKFIKPAFCFWLLLAGGSVLAQPGALDATFSADAPSAFSPGTGANSSVNALALQPDGKIIIGGNFLNYNSISTGRGLARVYEDGNLDTSFNSGSGVNQPIDAIALQPDGKIIIIGRFITFNDSSRNKIARVHADGSLDNAFNPGTDLPSNASLKALALQPDGKIIIGGNFSPFTGSTSQNIVRLNTDGSLDTTFNSGTGASYVVNSIVLQPDGKILIGGNFSTYNGTTSNNLARLNTDGTLDVTFNSGNGNGTIKSIVLQVDGKILIGGSFVTYNSVSRNGIARVNADGSLDTIFDPGTGLKSTYPFAGEALTLALQTDGKIIIGGRFTLYNGISRNDIVRVNIDGSLDTTFNPGTGAVGSGNSIMALASLPDGKVILGGDFAGFNGVGHQNFTRLRADGSVDFSGTSGIDFNFGQPIYDVVKTLTLQPDDKIIIGGDFHSYNGVARNKIARVNADGSADTTFNPGTGTNHDILALTLQPDGKIIIAGRFNDYNGTICDEIIRVNAGGSADTTFLPGAGNPGPFILALALQPDGKILIGGAFTTVRDSSRNHIARLNADGSLDATFNPGTGANNTVEAIVIQPDYKILIAGSFQTYNGTARKGFARVNADGSLDATFDPENGPNGYDYCLALQSDGKALIGGTFSSYNSVSRNDIARVNADGSLDTTFNPGTGTNNTINNGVKSIGLQPDGKIIIGGQFQSYNGTPANNIARLNADGSIDTTFISGNGADEVIETLTLQPDGKIIIGGDFSEYDDIKRKGLARVIGDFLGDCLVNSDCDDANACTVDSCDAANECLNDVIDCSDGDVCNGTETCDLVLGCQPSTNLNCDDGDACNGLETCDPVFGCQANPPPVCDDGDACNGVETCDVVLGCQNGTPLICDDNNVCNGTAICVSPTGCRGGTPLMCDDGNACNGIETCDPILGCQNGNPLICDDNDTCTIDNCDAVLGCTYAPNQYCDTVISGIIATTQGTPIADVTVDLTGTQMQSVVTGSNGQYSFTVQAGGNYTVKPSRSNDVTASNGISTLDLTIIQRHILNADLLPTARQIIAADGNGSGTVTTLDIILCRAIILGSITSFSNGKLWEFVADDHVFADLQEPFPFPDSIYFNNIAQSQTNQDFTGIKLGDVDNSWDPNTPKQGTIGNMQMAMNEYDVLPGDEVTVPVKVKDFKSISGYQFTLSWDAKVLSLVEVNNRYLSGYYGKHSISNGLFTTSWNDEQGKAVTLADGVVAFELTFKGVGAIGTQTAIKIGSEITMTEAYNGNLELLDIVPVNGMVKLGNATVASHQSSDISLTIQPNPFTSITNIIFKTPKDETVKLIIYDLLGKQVKKVVANYEAGKHVIEWAGDDDAGNLLSTGLYHVRMMAGEHNMSKKVVIGR